jgi:hypothetical protein
MMSQENVEIVRRWNTAYNERDYERLFELTAPDRAGKVFRIETFTDRGEGRRALGLADQGSGSGAGK